MSNAAASVPVEQSAIRKVATRLVPFVALMFFINFLDRTAIGFAAPNGMEDDLALTATQFGFASGVFFIGYILLEVPSNIALHKVGARRWLARIMVTWGLLLSCSPGYRARLSCIYCDSRSVSPKQDFSPGAILFLSLFVPARHRAKILSLFYLAQPLTIVIGAPLASF